MEKIEADDPQTPRGWKERLSAAWNAAAALVSTRIQIFQQELSEKTGLAARGVAGIVLGLVFGWLALLLLTALIAALLALLFGHLWAGLLAAFVLYLAVAGAAVAFGVKSFSRVRPCNFPATSEELKKAWSAIRQSASPGERVISPPAAERVVPAPYRAPASSPVDDLEERFRAGSGEGGE